MAYSKTQKDKIDEENPHTLTGISNLAGVLIRQGKYERAKGMHRRTQAERDGAVQRAS